MPVYALPDGAPPIENTLLASIPEKYTGSLLAALEPVLLTFGDTLHERGETLNHVYFPGDALVSLLAGTDGHAALEVGLIGREGMVGVSLALGHAACSVSALVQGNGSALRMRAAPFRKELHRNPPLRDAVLHYIDSLLAQIAQTAACNHFHQVEQRLARWLLMSSDRLRLDHFRMTHEFLGHMLGVRRVGVTEAAHRLHLRGLIAYSRGDITILDRPGLEAAACSCYAVVKAIYERESVPPEASDGIRVDGTATS